MTVRVVYVSDGAWYGGAERYIVRLGGHLDRSRFSVALIHPDRSSLDAFSRDARSSGFEVGRIPAGRFAGFRDPVQLQRRLSTLSPDIVHLNLPSSYDLSCGWAAVPARLGGAKAVVATEHIVDIKVSRRRAIARRMANGWIDSFIAISEANRRIMIERHGVPEEKSRVVLNGISNPGPPPEKPPSPFVIACVGSLEPRKGQSLILDAFVRLVKRGVDSRLVLVGSGPDRSTLEACVKRTGVADRVRFAGAVESAVEEIGAAHILAVPSMSEGIPFVVLEGMACGAVVVSSNLPGLCEVLEPGRSGWIVDSRDAEAWTRQLEALHRDRACLDACARAARMEFDRRFHVERMVLETQAIYDGVLG